MKHRKEILSGKKDPRASFSFERRRPKEPHGRGEAVFEAVFEVMQEATLLQALEKRLLQLGDNWIILRQKLLLMKRTNQSHHRPGEKVVRLEA